MGTRFFLGIHQLQRGGFMMDQWIGLIQEIGFPIIVSFYLLHRIETKLSAIHDVLVIQNTK